MADLSITPGDVHPVKIVEQFTGPAGENIEAGQYVRFDTVSGKIVLGNATTAAEARKGGIAIKSARAGLELTAVRKGVLDVGDALSELAYDTDVYLSDTDGTLADEAGTVSTIVGTVVPGYGHTTPDKLLRLDL